MSVYYGDDRTSHGPACTTKSHPMECPKCGAEGMWYECRHGSRVLLERVWGELVRHQCDHGNDDIPQVRHRPVDTTPRRRPKGSR